MEKKTSQTSINANSCRADEPWCFDVFLELSSLSQLWSGRSGLKKINIQICIKLSPKGNIYQLCNIVIRDQLVINIPIKPSQLNGPCVLIQEVSEMVQQSPLLPHFIANEGNTNCQNGSWQIIPLLLVIISGQCVSVWSFYFLPLETKSGITRTTSV